MLNFEVHFRVVKGAMQPIVYSKRALGMGTRVQIISGSFLTQIFRNLREKRDFPSLLPLMCLKKFLVIAEDKRTFKNLP